MLLEQTLIVTPQEYSNLKNGGIALFYTPIPNHRKFIVLPQSRQPQPFTPQIFIEIVGRDLTRSVESRHKTLHVKPPEPLAGNHNSNG